MLSREMLSLFSNATRRNRRSVIILIRIPDARWLPPDTLPSIVSNQCRDTRETCVFLRFAGRPAKAEFRWPKDQHRQNHSRATSPMANIASIRITHSSLRKKSLIALSLPAASKRPRSLSTPWAVLSTNPPLRRREYNGGALRSRSRWLGSPLPPTPSRNRRRVAPFSWCSFQRRSAADLRGTSEENFEFGIGKTTVPEIRGLAYDQRHTLRRRAAARRRGTWAEHRR